MENLGIFYDHLVSFMAKGIFLWPFGILCAHLVYFPQFWYFYQEKSGNPDKCQAKHFIVSTLVETKACLENTQTDTLKYGFFIK
jgi:hypothetical protein